MARYRANDISERRTKFVGFQVTPSERAELEAAAAAQGATLSDYGRAQLLRRHRRVAAAPRHAAEAPGLMRELNAIGNNLNQLMPYVHTAGRPRDWGELQAISVLIKQAIVRVLEL
jgi:hypothetical protein